MNGQRARGGTAGKAPIAWGLVLACLGIDGTAVADGFRADLTPAGRFDQRPAIGLDDQWFGSVTPQVGFSRHAAYAQYDAEAYRRFDSLGGDVSPRPASD